MNILFLTLLDFENLESQNIYTDLLRKFYHEGHCVSIISPVERKKKTGTQFLKLDSRLNILKFKIGNIQKTNIIEKGISTVLLESIFVAAIKKYYGTTTFDLVLYSTPPITLQKAVNYIKKRDHAVTYLMLKDIFPQNAVDMGMLSKHGGKKLLYSYFRRKERLLYRDSDYIGCMSSANVEYLRKHNSQIEPGRIGLCPNCIEPICHNITAAQKNEIRKKLGLPEGKLLFVYGGNLGRPQGIPFLIECLKRVGENRDAFFLIVGNGTEYGKLETFIEKENPQNVRLLPALPKAEYENMILAADVGMIFLDHRFTIPNFPSRLLSYMQAKIPVLAVTDPNTDIGKVIVSGGFGWWCESNHIEEFAKNVERAQEADLNGMGEKAYAYMMEHYTAGHVYQLIMSKVNKDEAIGQRMPAT